MTPRALLLRALAAAAMVSAAGSAGCGPTRPSAKASAPAVAAKLTIESFLSRPADVILTVRPPEVARDRVYGALLRQASALASGYAGAPLVGTTALALMERSESVQGAMDDAGEVVVVLRGVPGDLDASQVVDPRGGPLWRAAVGDVRRSFAEYAPTTEADAALFVVPGRVWVVVSGNARARAREALVSQGEVSLVDPDPGLAWVSIRGPALLDRDPRLRAGPLAPLGRSLLHATAELTPGSLGVLITRLDYAEPGSAAGAEALGQAIVAAFRKDLEERARDEARSRSPAPPLSWLAGAHVERIGAKVTVRAPIPRPWLDSIARADLGEAPAGTGAAPKPASSAKPATPGQAPAEAPGLPWDLWRRASPKVPSLTPDLAPSLDPAQEPSQ